MNRRQITLDGRPAEFRGMHRTANRWKFYNRVTVRFLDDDSWETMSEGAYAKRVERRQGK